LTITYNTATDEIEALEPELIDVVYTGENPVTPDEAISEIVDRWQIAVDEQLSEEIGYTDVAIEQRSAAQANLITDAWLWAYPAADIAITNTGGMRQTLDAGVLTWGDIVGVLPFDNQLIAVELTGQQVIDNLRCCGGAIAGITYMDGSFVLNDGSALQADEIYTVLVNDFMYYGGDGYLFESQNPDGYNTNIHWRQPVIDYILSLETSEENPLSNHLDTTGRLR
jgi:2',3'-cyclic-nucleotide 2'-phosphodiesterase (5'-nucleotidase family)